MLTDNPVQEDKVSMATAITGATWATMTMEEKRAAWSRVSPEDQAAARDAFRQRCQTHNLSPAITNVGRIKALTRVGDVEVFYPKVDVSQLPSLETDEVMAVAAAEMVIQEAQRQRAMIAATTPGSGRGTQLVTFDVATAPGEIVIVTPLAGG
jgi:hypothetical protein